VINVPLESLFIGDWIRSVAWVVVAVAGPILGAAALMSGRPAASFAQLLALRGDRLALAMAAVLATLTVLAIQATLGLVFDPRYRDFPFTPLTAAVVPFAVLAVLTPMPQLPRLRAETTAAGLFALSAPYILFNESFANWQSIWFCLGIAVLTACLWRARGTPG
jgi:glucan 1,3-beta-glucosidase